MYPCQPASNAANQTIFRFNALRAASPKPVILTEFGWPGNRQGMGDIVSTANVYNGQQCGIANLNNQRQVNQQIIDLCARNNLPCSLFASNNEPWKGNGNANDVNNFWGICSGVAPYDCFNVPTGPGSVSVPVPSPPATTQPPCWTCPAGQVHWYDAGIASAPGGDRCACVPAPTTPSGCPSGWTKYEGFCYRFYNNPSTFRQSSTFCRSQGGYLASIVTWQMNSWVKNFVPSRVAEFWIGGSRANNNSPFFWDSRRSWAYQNFGEGAPVSWGNYVSFINSNQFGVPGKWRTIGNEYSKPFLCELKA
ncbi:Snaclec subunit [Acrasis kona]|uniref:Snaclec subunit n=1 Tax=Acrasis kona TaxID=1008807 RepID=A0AAW2ZCM7_9EUKA